MAIDSSQFKHQSVRDLAWAVSSPPLISQLSSPCVWPQSLWYQQLGDESLSWLITVDADPAELDELLAGQRDRRLGKYFETLWFYWLSHHQRYQIIEKNIQITIEGETLGEIDFIVYDRSAKQTFHWEVAIKFYLGVGNTREMSNWHGPNLHDRLDIKVNHLLFRQSLISKDARVAQWLKQNGMVIDQCAVILKGRLYYPRSPTSLQGQDNASAGVISPPQCAPDHLLSWWIKRHQLEEIFDSKQCFVPLINEGWLEKIPTSPDIEAYSKKALFEIVSNNELRLPLHVQLCKPCGDRDRVFLVDEHWPDKIT